MESSPATPSRNIVYPAMKLQPSSSSSPLVSSLNVPDYEDSPATPPFRFSGVPFSWEHVPGIPKKQSFNCMKKEHCNSSSSVKVLPLPPTTSHQQAPRKKPSSNSKHTSTFLKDPFVAALVQCSKKEDEEEEKDQYSKNNGQADKFQWSAKVSRSVSDRFGFVNLYVSSCKRSCEVSQSTVHVPRPISRTSSNYDLIRHRSRSP